MPKSSKRSKSSSKDRSTKKDAKDKSKSSKKEEFVEEVVEEVPVQQPVESKKPKKEKTSKATKEEVAKDTEVADESTADVEVEVDGKRTRRVVTKESVLEEFDALLKDVEAEVEALRSSDAKNRKSKGVKFMRAVGKRIKGLRNDSSRVMRTRKQSTRPKNTSSGFMKPVQISAEMAQFTGWEPDVPRSRVDVTKYLCQYIRDNNLQNPEDRRIIRPDSQLKTLLKLQGGEKDPLTYYSLQKSIQHHFTNDAKASA